MSQLRGPMPLAAEVISATWSLYPIVPIPFNSGARLQP